MRTNRSRPRCSSTPDLLEDQIAPFMAELAAAGYSAGALHKKRSALRQFLDWRRRRKRSGRETTESEVTLFLQRAWPVGSKHRSPAPTTLSAFLQHLRRQGLISTPVRKPANTPGSLLQDEYAGFLRHEKGLAERSLLAYLPVVPDLLSYLTKKHRKASVRQLNGDTLRAFLFERVRGRSSAYVRLLSASLRSFLRFLHARGNIRRDLLAAIPTVRRQAQPDIPKVLSPEEVSRVLAAPEQTSATGRRNYAILLLLARLGLRASEVLLLEVGDLRWRTGEILIHGKGHRQDLLPLPHEVGTALARYLRLDRGVHSTTKRVFLRTYAPRVPLSGPASIGYVVRRAMAQAGVERPHRTAAHLFRHSLASRMLRHGAHLQDIGEVLRHRAPSSTEIYAKIDLRSLQEVVRPWPVTGGAQ